MIDDARLAARRQHLTSQLAAIPAAWAAAVTHVDLAAVQQQRATVEQQLATLNAAVAAVQSLGSTEADEQWLAHLTAWRETLCDERMEIKSPIRNPVLKARETNLSLSIKTIDRGLRVLDNSGYDLTTIRLGELMIASGFAIVGADPATNYAGTLPWCGSMPEVEKRIATLAAKRQQAEAALDAAVLTDDERHAIETEAAARRTALNALIVKVSLDGASLVAYKNRQAFYDNQPYAPEEMTPIEREAFTRLASTFR